MVRETRYLWVGNLPEKVTEERVIEHFERYGKIQSVKLLPNDGGERPSATVAFMDIKSASKAHNTDHELDGIHVPTKYSEPSGNSVTITRTLDPEVPSTSRDGHRGYTTSGLTNKNRFPNRTDGLSEDRGNYERGEWYAGRGSGGEGSSSNFSENRSRSSTQGYENDDQYPDRGRSKQRFTAPQSVRSTFNQRQHYEREGGSTPRSSQFDQNYSQEKHGEKRARTKAWGSQSPARSDISNLSSRQRTVTYGSASHSGSRSRSSSSSSSSRSSSSSSRSGSRRKGIKSEVASKNEIPSVSTQPSSGGESGEKRNLGICIRGLPIRSTDTSLRDGLYHEYKKHGKVTSVNIFGQNDDRYAIVSFKKPEDATKAIEASHEKMFFGTKIHVTSHEGFEVEDDFKTPEADLDEFHPKATRTLFVGNLEKEISIPTLKEIFKPFGEIIDIDIKKQGAVSAYAFVQYADITSVVRALRQMDGEHIGANKIKLGFGKSMPTNCVWLDNVAESLTEKCLCRQFSRYGPVSHSVIDKIKGRGLIYFDNMDFAQHAVNEMRARFLNGNKIHIDFASRDCQTAFFEKMERTGQLRPGERPDERAGRVHRSASGVYSVRYDAPVTIATTSTEIVKDVVKEKERYETSTRITRTEPTEQYAFTSRTAVPTRSFQPSTTNNSRTTFTARSSRGLGNRQGFVDGNYTQEEFRERRPRHYDEYSPDGGSYGEDTYEQELRDYGYRQQERRERGSLSPRDKRREITTESPFPRGSRHQSPIHERHDRYEDRYSDRYSNRYRDTDSQSGDRESVCSYRSVRSEARRDFRPQSSFEERYPERYVEEKRDHIRGFSPTSSDYSHHSHSPGRYRSRSNSPMSVGKERKVLNVKERVVVRQVVAPSSLDDYSHGGQSSRNSSPMDYDMPTGKLKDIKSSKYASVIDSKSKERYTDDRDIRERYGSEERTTISELIRKPRPASYSETDKITAVSSKVKKPKFDSDDELPDIDRITEVKDRPSKKRYPEDIVLESKDRPNDEGKRLDKRRSRSSSLGSRTRIIPTESEPMEYQSDNVPKSKDLPGEVGVRTGKSKGVKSDVPLWNPKSVEKPKKSEPYDPFENKSGGSSSGSSSDSSSSSSEGEEEEEEEEEESTVEPDQGKRSATVRLQKQQDYLLTLIQQLDDRVSDNDSLIGDDKNARKRIRIDGEETTKLSPKSRQLLLKEIDQVKKNIEDLEREEQREKGLMIDSSKSYRKQMEQRRLEQQKQQPSSAVASDSKPDHAPASPTHDRMEVDEEVLESGPDLSPKEIPTEFKKKRKGEGGESESGKTRKYRAPHATEDLFNRINEDDDKPAKTSDAKELDKLVEKLDKPSDPRTAAHTESGEVTSRQSSIESQDPRSPPLEYRRDSKGILEIRTDFENKDSPIDRRSLHLVESHSKRDFPMSLPLPKFARQQQKEGKNSPKSHISTKTVAPSTPAAVVAAAGPQVKSPPFSPSGALASPLHSPALPKVDTPKDTSSLPNSVPSSEKDKELKPPPAKADSSKDKKTLSTLASPGSPVIKTDSDSEVSETEPGELSLEERIRALDEKMSLTAKPPSTPTTPSLLDYREKYKIRRRADSSASSLSSLPEKSEPSDIVKTVLARSSIFDQDSKRLEQIQEKYEPKVNVTLDDGRSLGVFRTKQQTISSAKELSLLSGTQQPGGNVLPLHQSLQNDSGQISPPFLGASASAALAEAVNNTPSAGELMGNSGHSPIGVVTGAFSANLQSISKHGSSSPVVSVPPPPPPAAGSQRTPPAPSSPSAPPASGASNHPTGASPKRTGLDAMPELSVAISTPSMSPGLIGRKGSLESATKSPLTPPVATTATSNVASMPSPSQTQPPHLDLSSPKVTRKESFGSSSLSSTSSVPSTPVSILKKQDSYEVFSPVTPTPILKKDMPPLTPVLKEQPSPPMKEKKEQKDTQPTASSASTPAKRDSSSSILGKRKASEDKTLTPKQDKGSHRSSSQSSVNKQDSGSSSRSSVNEPETKKPKLSTKDKSLASKTTSQKEVKPKSNKHGSTSVSSKSPEKKHTKLENGDKKKPDDKHSKHSEKSNSKDRDLAKDEESSEKVKENTKDKVKDSEKEIQRKEHKEEKESVKNREPKHKVEKSKDTKDVKDCKDSKESGEKKTEKNDSQREKKEKARSKSGDKHHSTKNPSSNNTDIKSKTTEMKHKDKHKAEKTDKQDKAHKHDKSEKLDKDEKTTSQEKVEKPNSSEKSKYDPLDKAAKPEVKEKSTRHEKKVDKQDPRLKHKAKDNKDKKEEKTNKASSHDSKEVKPEKKGGRDGDKKEKKSKEKDQEKEERKDNEKNKNKDCDKSKKNYDSHKESESSSEKEKETKEERENREMKELLALQAKFDAEDRVLGYGPSMYDVVKRRSSKEAEKEFENAARQRQLNAYQVSRRKKSRQTKSEDAGSSTQNSDDESATSSSTMETSSIKKRERIEPKNKTKKSRVIESSSDEEDDASPHSYRHIAEKEKELKKVSVSMKIESSFESEDEPIPTPRKMKKKDVDKKEKMKKKKPKPVSSESESEDEVHEKPVTPPPPPVERMKEKKKASKSKAEVPEVQNRVIKTPKGTPKAKDKKKKLLVSSSDDDMDIPIRPSKKESNVKKPVIHDISTAEEEEMPMPMPRPKAKAKKDRVIKNRILDYDSEEKEPEKPTPVTPKPHKEKTKEHKPIPTVTATTIYENDKTELDTPVPSTPTPVKQKKNKEKHKGSAKKEKSEKSVEINSQPKLEEVNEIKTEKPEKPHKKSRANKEESSDSHHHKSTHSNNKDGTHTKSGKTEVVAKEKESSHSHNKEPRIKKEVVERESSEKEKSKDRSHQDTIASMMKEIKGDSYEVDPKMPNLDDDKHPLDELLKEEARLEAEQKRDQVFNEISSLRKESTKASLDSHRKEDSLGPPEIVSKVNDVESSEGHFETPKNKEDETLKKSSKKDTTKKGKKLKKKPKTHDEDSVSSSTSLLISQEPKEEPVDLPSLTKEDSVSEAPVPEEDKVKKEEKSELRRSSGDNIFEKMERKEDPLVTVEPESNPLDSLEDAPALQPVSDTPIKSMKKDLKKDAGKLKETSQDELQRAVESILGADPSPPPSDTPKLEFPEEPAKVFPAPLEPEDTLALDPVPELTMAVDTIPKPEEELEPQTEQAQQAEVSVPDSEQDEEEARKAAAALAFLTGDDPTEEEEDASIIPPSTDITPDDQDLQPSGIPPPTSPIQIEREATAAKVDENLGEEISEGTQEAETTTITPAPSPPPSTPPPPPAPAPQTPVLGRFVPIPPAEPIPDLKSVKEKEPLPEVKPEPEADVKPEPKPEEKTEQPEAAKPEPEKPKVKSPPRFAQTFTQVPPIVPTPVESPIHVLPKPVLTPPEPPKAEVVKETKKDPYAFDEEEEPEEGVPSMDILRHKSGHVHLEARHTALLSKPVSDDGSSSLSLTSDVHKSKGVDIGSPERRVFSDSDSCEVLHKGNRKNRRVTKANRGRKKSEAEPRVSLDTKEEEHKSEPEREEHIPDPVFEATPEPKVEKLEEKPQRQSPRAKDKTTPAVLTAAPSVLLPEEKPVLSKPEPEKPELKITIPLDSEQRKTREGRKQEAPDVVSTPLESPAEFSTLGSEPPVIEPPKHTEDAPIEDTGENQEILEEGLTDQESTTDTPREEGRPRRTKGRKKAKEEEEEEEKDTTGQSSLGTTQKEVQRSPSARIRAKQEEQKKDSPDVKVSSRGRIIIPPKGRDGEITPIRKGRKPAGMPEPTEPVRGRGRRGATSPASAMLEPEAKGKTPRGRRTPKRFEKEEEHPDLAEEEKRESALKGEGEGEEEASDTEEQGRGVRRTARRRKPIRRNLTGGSDKDILEKEEDNDESSKDGSLHEDTTVQRHNEHEGGDVIPESPKQGRKARRCKNRKSVEGPGMSPRRGEGPPGSPRGKALEQGSTSPKNMEFKPIVKLEKLPLNDLRNQESSSRPTKEDTTRKEDETREREEDEISVSAHPAPRIGITFRGIGARASLDAASKPKKDQYDFEDDDEKVPHEYVARRPKRKVSPRQYEDISMDSCMPESKRLKSEERSVEASDDGGKSADESAKSEHEDSGHKKGGEAEEKVYLDPKTGLLLAFPSSASPDTVLSDTKQDLPKPPLKVEIKPENEHSAEENKAPPSHPETVPIPPKIRHNRKHEEAQRALQQQQQQQVPVKTEPTVPPLKITIAGLTPTTSIAAVTGWETNMDRIITAVARGELGTENEHGHVDNKQSKRKRKTSHVEEHPHPVPEQPKAPQVLTPMIPQQSKPSPTVPPQNQGLHGAPQVAYPATPTHPPSSSVSTSHNNKAVLTPPHTVLAPSMHQMPQQIPQKSPNTPMAIANTKGPNHQAQNQPPTSVIHSSPHQGAPAANSAQTGHPRKLQHAGYPVREPSIERERRGPSPASTRPPVSVASNVQMDVVQQAYSIPSHEANPPGQVGKVNVIEIVPNPNIMSPKTDRPGEAPVHPAPGISQPQQHQGQHSQQSKPLPQVPHVPPQQHQALQNRASPSLTQGQVFPQTQSQPAHGPRPQGLMPSHQQGQHPPGKVHPQGQAPHPQGQSPHPQVHSPHPQGQSPHLQGQHTQAPAHQQQPSPHPPRPTLGKISPASTASHVLHQHVGPPLSLGQKDQPGLPAHMQMPHYPAFSHASIQNPATTTTTQSSIPQTSELRAALQMPSKLVQQEQLLQQQRLQQQQQQQQHLLRPMGPHTQEQQPSPGGTYGLHRMPFTLPEQRPGISRAEPKVPAERPPEVPASQAQFREQIHKQGPPSSTPGSSAFSQPHPEQRVPLAHPERLLAYSGAPELRFPHPPVPGVVPYPGGPSLGISLPPRLGMDPRLMFAGTQPPLHEYPSHLVSPGLIPQHLLAGHQQPAQIMNPERPPSGRPLSRTTPPSAQPSPRPTPPPSREQPLAQGSIPSALSQHPSQVLNTLMKGGPLQEDTHADDLYRILRRYPVMWQGVLALKNDSSNVQMHYLAGSQRLVRQALPPMTVEGLGQPLRIAQRMRLEQSQLEGVHRKMQNEEEYSMLLAIPCGRDHLDILAHTKALQAGFIQYLSAKQAAGIVNLAEPGSGSAQPAYVVHIFPPCEFSQQQMADLTPDLLQGINEIAHLLIVIATVSSQ